MRWLNDVLPLQIFLLLIRSLAHAFKHPANLLFHHNWWPMHTFTLSSHPFYCLATPLYVNLHIGSPGDHTHDITKSSPRLLHIFSSLLHMPLLHLICSLSEFPVHRMDLNLLQKLRHKGELGKRATWACTKTTPRSQLHIFDIGSCAWVNPHNELPE